MEIYRKQAKDKIHAEMKKVKGNESAILMTQDVAEMLCFFCDQSNEFAQSVVQGGSFVDCMNAVAKGEGKCLSDIEAYRKAVKFYFPTATVKFDVTINTEGNNSVDEPEKVATPPSEEKTAITLSLDELLEW